MAVVRTFARYIRSRKVKYKIYKALRSRVGEQFAPQACGDRLLYKF